MIRELRNTGNSLNDLFVADKIVKTIKYAFESFNYDEKTTFTLNSILCDNSFESKIVLRCMLFV